MQTYRGERSPWIVHHEFDGAGTTQAGDRIATLRRSFRGAAERAALPEGFVQHDLRHRRVTEWLRQGHSAHKVQLAMGHADLATTIGYAHLVEDDLLTLVEAPKQSTGTAW